MQTCVSPEDTVSPRTSEDTPGVRCSSPCVPGSSHCAYHRKQVLRSWRKYKKQGERVERLQDALEKEDSLDTLYRLLSLHASLERECEMRLEHRRRFFMPQFHDEGHTEALERRRELVNLCDARLEAVFQSLEQESESTQGVEAEVSEDRDLSIQRKKFKRTRRRIRTMEAEWGKLEELMAREREKVVELRNQSSQLRGLIEKCVIEIVRKTGEDPQERKYLHLFQVLVELCPIGEDIEGMRVEENTICTSSVLCSTWEIVLALYIQLLRAKSYHPESGRIAMFRPTTIHCSLESLTEDGVEALRALYLFILREGTTHLPSIHRTIATLSHPPLDPDNPYHLYFCAYGNRLGIMCVPSSHLHTFRLTTSRFCSTMRTSRTSSNRNLRDYTITEILDYLSPYIQ